MQHTRKPILCFLIASACVPACDSMSPASVDGAAIGTASQAVLIDQSLTGDALPPNTVVLTFDDGPDDLTLQIAQYLASEGIHATFFVNGKRFCKYVNGVCTAVTGSCPLLGDQWKNDKLYDESLLDTLQAYGHRIANHTQDHCDLPSNPDQLDFEIKTTQEILDRHIASPPFLFRAPYADWNQATGDIARGDVCLDKIDGPIFWDIGGNDWACWLNGTPVDQCLQQYLESWNARPNHNGIVLMHDRPEYNVDDPSYYAGPNNTLELVKRFVPALRAQGVRFAPIEEAVGDGSRVRNWSACGNYSDGDGFAAAPGYYDSIHLADVDGDGLADACGRSGGGIVCAKNLSNGQFGSYTDWLTSDFTDALGWLPAEYGGTVMFADLNHDGRADVCGRAGAGILCALAQPQGGFGAPILWSTDFSDFSGWAGGESYWGSLRLADIDGDGFADVCGRNAGGISCALNGRNGSFLPATVWMPSDFTDSVGWFPPQYGTTIQLGDIDGDGRVDVCGRGLSGIRCALAQPGGGFGPPGWWTTGGDFSDNDTNAGGWQSPEYYHSIRLADVDGDGRADVCGRTSQGIVCAHSRGSAFDRYHLMVYPAPFGGSNDYTDALGWASDQYAATLQFGRLDHDARADVCGRGGRGLLCALTH